MRRSADAGEAYGASIKDGIQMHDLLRAYVLARFAPKELEELHTELLTALAAHLAEEQKGDVANYARSHLESHAAGACASCAPPAAAAHGGGSAEGEGAAPPPLDAGHVVLGVAMGHSVEWVRCAAARGVGLPRRQATARAAGAVA